MSRTTKITIRMDSDLKAQADTLFGELGMDMTTAFNIFVRQSLLIGGFPFEIKLNGADKEINAAKIAMSKLQKELEGEAESLDLKGDEDVVKMVKEISQEIWDQQQENND